jgi:hypothetical protein
MASVPAAPPPTRPRARARAARAAAAVGLVAVLVAVALLVAPGHDAARHAAHGDTAALKAQLRDHRAR